MAKEELLGEVKKLISRGKEKGYLTYEELNSTLPADLVSSEQLSNLMTIFGEMDIEIVDAAEGDRAQKMADGGEAAEEAPETEELEEGEKEIDLTPGVLSRTDDPVRLSTPGVRSISFSPSSNSSVSGASSAASPPSAIFCARSPSAASTISMSISPKMVMRLESCSDDTRSAGKVLFSSS